MNKPPRQFEKPFGVGTARCIDCYYVLEGLESDQCPECGRPFNPRAPASFTLRAPYVGWVFWLPALILSVGGTLLITAAILLGSGHWGWAVWIAVPFAGGAVLGYRFRSRWFLLPILGLTLILCTIFGLLSLQLAGIFCGLTLAVLLLGPVTLGIVAGTFIRFVLKLTSFSQRSHLPVLLLFLFPVICALIENAMHEPYAHETVSTSIRIDADAMVCFDAIVFYEEVTHDPPWILRLGLARPLYTTGSSVSPGDEKICIYNKGRIVKRVTDVKPGERLAFEVVEQRIGYERDVRLRRGAFLFETLEDGSTLVTLTTTYEPLLGPRWSWRPFEEFATHTLHEYVLEGMRIEAQRRGGGRAARVDVAATSAGDEHDHAHHR